MSQSFLPHIESTHLNGLSASSEGPADSLSSPRAGFCRGPTLALRSGISDTRASNKGPSGDSNMEPTGSLRLRFASVQTSHMSQAIRRPLFSAASLTSDS
jgi:hypothetical protein